MSWTDNAADTADKQYRSPTDKFFEKLLTEKQDVRQAVAKKQSELSELQNSCKPLATTTLGNKKPVQFVTQQDMIKLFANFCCVCLWHYAKKSNVIQEEKCIRQLQSEFKALKGKSQN